MTTNVVRIPVFLCLATVVTLVAAQNAPEDMQKFLEGVAGCHRTYSALSNDTVQYAMIHDMAVPDESNEDARCFVVCVMQNMGLVQSDGSMDVDKAYASLSDYQNHLRSQGKMLSESDAKAVLRSCASESGSGKCEKAYRIIKCSLSGLGTKVKSA